MLKPPELMQGDCLELMSRIPDGSVDMVMADLPYGTTACKWDSVIPFEPLWYHYKRVCKKCSAIVLTASQPFTSSLVFSNVSNFRYSLVWDKGYSTGYGNANKMPMRGHEDIIVFYQALPTYNPQGITVSNRTNKRGNVDEHLGKNGIAKNEYRQQFANYPKSIITTKKEASRLHPTQKPVALMEYLILTYTNEGETVLDNTMGSGTTGVACANTGRNFIGIERDEKYFQIAKERIEQAYANRPMV